MALVPILRGNHLSTLWGCPPTVNHVPYTTSAEVMSVVYLYRHAETRYHRS